MGNACSCVRSSCSSSLSLQDLDLSADFGNQICSDFTEETVNQLVLRMDELIHNLRTGARPPTQQPPSSSAVSAATLTASQIVNTLSHRIEREIPERKCCGKTSTETLKRCGMAALDNHTAKFVSEVLGKIENVPYVGMAASLVVFALEHVHQTSANDGLRLGLLQHMSTLVKHMNSVRAPHHREKFHDIILLILKITISIVNQIQSPSVSRVLFAHLDAADFQKLEKDLSDEFNELALDLQLSAPQTATPSSQSYCPAAVGIEDDIEEVKAKLKMGHEIATPSIQSYSPTAVGIEDAIEEVKDKLKMGNESRRVVAIFGMGGIGKTTLATEVVNSLSSDIEAAYAFCRLDMDIKSTDIVHLQEQLLHVAFNNSRTRLMQAIEGHVSASSSYTSKPLFLFIDNALKEDEVRKLLPIDRLSQLPLRSRILVTTRNLKEIQALMKMQEFEIAAHNVAENQKAKQMLCHYALGNQDSAFPEGVELEALLEICGGVPLIIQMAGMYLRGSSDMANSCRYITQSILSRNTSCNPNGRHEDSDGMVDFVYGQLSKPLQTLLLDIAFFYLGNKREEVEYMLEDPTLIQELEDAALLSQDENGRLKMHDIIRERSEFLSESEGRRICGQESWERAKADPEILKTIKGVKLRLRTQHDLDFITKCTAMTTLHLWVTLKKPLKLHLWPSLQIVSLSGSIIVNVDQLLPTNLVTLKLHNVMVNDIRKFYQRIGHFHKLCCLELVELEGARAELGSFRELSSLRRLRLSSYHSQRLPQGFENLVGLQSLQLDDCMNLCQLPKGLQKYSHLKELDLKGCSMLDRAVESWHQLTSLQQLSMKGCRSLKFISEDIGRLLELKTLDISGCEMLQKLPNSFGDLSSLEYLDMRGCKNLDRLSVSFSKLSKLKELNLRNCEKLQNLPDSFGNLSSLEKLQMAHCNMLECLCESFGELLKLKELDISICEELEQLPDNFGSLSKLETLNILGCEKLQELPDSFVKLSKLRSLHMTRCRTLLELPNNFGDLLSLEYLDMSYCKMLECPRESFCELLKLKQLIIAGFKRLEQLPDSFGSLSELEILNILGCDKLQKLPDSFVKLSKLRILDMTGCDMLEKLPNNFGDLLSLEYLDMSECRMLECLCESFGNLLSLKQLYMNDCSSLECLCGNFGQLSKLKELEMADCESLETLPVSFANLSSLKELSLRGCIGLQKLPERMQQMSCLQFLNLRGCKNIQICAEGLPCSLSAIDIDECQCNKLEFTSLLRRRSLFLVWHTPSWSFQECYHSHCLQNNSLPFALPFYLEEYIDVEKMAEEMKESEVGAWLWEGGGGSGFMRMKGDNLVWEEAKTSAVTRNGAQIALLMTGLCLDLPDECREALQEAAKEGYEIVWIDCGVWRWNRYISCSKSDEFRGEVEWDDEDMQRMREMLQMIPEGCTKCLWTSLFPKNCLVLALFLCCCFWDDTTGVFAEDIWLVKGRCTCRSEGIIDCEEVENFKMDGEVYIKEEMKRIEIPDFGFPFSISNYLEKVANFLI